MLFHATFGSPSVKHPHPLIFLHGFLGSHHDWIPVINQLQDSYLCIALDLPFHGSSQGSADPFSLIEHTLHAFPSALIIGYSLGGRLSLRYAQSHPTKVKGLVACSSHLGLATEKEKLDRMKNDLLWKNRLLSLSPQDFLLLWYEQTVFSSLKKKPFLLQSLLEERLYSNPENMAFILETFSLAKQPLYENFVHPIRLIFGEYDTAYELLYAKYSETLKEKIPYAGHVIHRENPIQSASAIRRFAEELSF